MLDVTKLAPGTKGVRHLRVADPDRGEDLAIPVLIVKGRAPEPVFAVLGAVHGDEFEGVLAIQDAYHGLSPSNMLGTFVGVPVTNLPAYRARSRITPHDGKNLARVFPGRPDGTITERIAFTVGSAIIRRADFLLDLHSSGTTLTSPTLVGYRSVPGPAGESAAKAAVAFGADVVWVHETTTPGSTISFAADLGIPSLYTEANGGMRVREDDLHIYTEGILNVMGHLGMVERRPGSPPRHFLTGGGSTDGMLEFTTEGVFRPRVRVLQSVRQGECLGEVRGMDGSILERIVSPHAGRVAFLRAVPPVVPGNAAALVARDRTPVPSSSNS